MAIDAFAEMPRQQKAGTSHTEFQATTVEIRGFRGLTLLLNGMHIAKKPNIVPKIEPPVSPHQSQSRLSSIREVSRKPKVGKVIKPNEPEHLIITCGTEMDYFEAAHP
jgi:hypothetical protein